MFKEENLDLEGKKGIKTYAEMSERERQEFKERKEQELKILKDSFVKYGILVKGGETEFLAEYAVPTEGTENEFTIEEKIKGVEFNIEEEGEKLKLIIEQEYGAGIRGLGSSDSSVWMCLGQERDSFIERDKWDANTVLDFREKYSGITFEDVEKNERGETKMIIKIDADHPVVTSANLYGKNKEVYLPGDFNGWKVEEPLEFNEKTGGLEGIIVWDKKRKAQCKIAIHIKSDWEDGCWGDDARQKMEIDLEEDK